ncbi:MAG: YitT family protein, partial [Bacteroidota bacterium]|nr:YitT family protein [Bacteroidota bacterium]
MAVAYVYFISPYKIVPGGVYGVSIVLHHMFGFNTGALAFVLSIPLVAIGVMNFGWKFFFRTFWGVILTSFFTGILTDLNGDTQIVHNALLSSIYGGALLGLGVGMVFKTKSTVGGSDVIAQLMSKHMHIPLSRAQVIVDGVIVLIGFAAFRDLEIPLYSWLVIFIMGKAIDFVLTGFSDDKSVFIISDKHGVIREKLLDEIGRGGTYLHGSGMYNGADKKVIFTVVARRELTHLMEIVHQVDDQAFMTVIDASEILGKGFQSLDEKVSNN